MRCDKFVLYLVRPCLFVAQEIEFRLVHTQHLPSKLFLRANKSPSTKTESFSVIMINFC